MNRELDTFVDGENHCKISHFTRKGFDINGVVHVGTNYGYELEQYRKMGIEYFMGFEPLPSAIEAFGKKYPTLATNKEYFFPVALGSVGSYDLLNIASGDGQGSTFLYPIEKEEFVDDVVCAVVMFDEFIDFTRMPMDNFDCLVIDVEGMELDVLIGMEDNLDYFKYLNIECSKDVYYEGGVEADAVIEWLNDMGFIQDSPTEVHNDIMFIRKDIKR